MDLNDKVVLITGAGHGLGQKMAEMIAGRGARLALAGLSEEGLQKTVELCQRAGAEARRYRVDVADETAVEDLFATAVRDLGRLDAVINNAGITNDGLLVKARDGKVTDKLSLDDWDAVIKVDLRGVFLCGREAAVRMVEQGDGGVIVNISSISRAGNIGQTNYAAAKAGVAAMTVTWARELARYGIRVAAIAPGFSDTRMVRRIPDRIREKLLADIPLRRFGKPEEIGHSAIYILENEFYNGRVLEVDGGMRL